jgi:hypothetical protein
MEDTADRRAWVRGRCEEPAGDLAIDDIDVARLVPEARTVARAAAAVYLRQTRPWFVGLIAHGSAIKGGAIPQCSDLDLQLYLEPTAFAPGGSLPVALALAIARDLARIDPSPYAYVQCYAWPCALPADHVGPIPGAYTVLAGRLPVPEASPAALRAGARRLLSKPSLLPSDLSASLLTSGPGRVERRARLICTDVWPVLYALLTLGHDDAVRLWTLPKEEALALLPEASAPGTAIRQFYAALRAYYPAQASPALGLEVVARGVEFLRAAKDWWDEWDKEGARDGDAQPVWAGGSEPPERG